MTNQEIASKYICPVCIKKGWKRPIEVDIINQEPLEWRWKCTYRRCELSKDWQMRIEPALDKKAKPKMGFE